MNLRRLTSVLSALFAVGMLTFTPIASALDVTFDLSTSSSDEAQGDVQSTDCASYDESLAAAVGCDTSTTVTDFTEFNGSMDGPDASGYDPKLTQNTNAREFVQSVVNWGLSFLGFIAVLIVIYGGVLYVTSRGDEEATSKGKKAISYAAIGILIIMGSYAFVNTILTAGGGAGSDLGNGSATNGTTVTEAGAAFDVDSVLEEIEGISADYKTSYDTYVTNTQEINYLLSIDMPLVVSVDESEYTVNGLVEGITSLITGTDTADSAYDFWTDEYTLISQEQIDDYLTELKRGIQNLQADVDPYSETYERAQTLYDYLRSGSTSTGFVKWLADAVVPAANAFSLSELADSYSSGTYTGDSCSTKSSADNADNGSTNLGNYRDVGLGLTVYNTNVDQIDDNICPMLQDLQTAADNDYSEQVNELVNRMVALGSLFDSDEQGFSSGSSLSSIKNGSSGTYDQALASLSSAADTIQASTVRNLLSTMNDFHTSVQDLEFVKVILSASTVEDNAPVIVRFDALGTEDPSGQTVTEENIQWDLDGDGSFSTQTLNGLSGAEPTGSAVSVTYTQAGTYRARVRVLSSSENIAAGISTVTIKVDPPRSKIVLDAQVGSDVSHIADFRTFPYIDAAGFKVTMAEAEAGVVLDASETTDGDDNTNGIILYEWDFGDSYSCSGGKTEDCGARVTHAYGEAGAYTVSLSVTDSTGVQDRKYFTLYVASPAARISYSPESGLVGTEFTFDSSASSVDVGQIVSRQWSATLNGKNVSLDSTSGTSIEPIFETPGVYTVSLTVADNSNKTDTATVEVLVESTAPVATYTYTIPKSNEPATVIFNATDSYDPDEGDTLTYEWDFDGKVGTDYEILDATNTGDIVTVQYLRKSDYNVVLTVKDSQTGDLQKSDTATTLVPIESVLDVNLASQGEDAVHLGEDGTVSMEFLARSSNASAFEIDYGDGSTDFTDSISNKQSIFTHQYEAAGIFSVTLKAIDDQNNENEISQRVYIGAGDAPIAVLDVTSEGNDIGFGDTLTGNVNTVFSFDASQSVNIDGSNDNLKYSWNFGDGTTSSASSATHKFVENTTYTVTLTVKDAKEPTLTSDASIKIEIKALPPVIHSLTTTIDSETLTTPLKVEVSVDATDEDSKITNYKAWYYDLDDTATELGTIVSQSNTFDLTIETKGEEGENKKYSFAVEVYSGNDIVSSVDELSSAEIPTLEVVNGPNDNPVAAFTVDKTSVYVGEEVHFSSTSYDPDGEIAKYWWDVEGNGFYDNEPETTGSYTYTFTQVHPDGVQVKLKVMDNAGASAESEPITIGVDAVSDAPEARFLTDVNGTSVTFSDNSVIDTENGATLFKAYWDLNLDVDTNGNGVVDDDIDSEETNPTYDYKSFGNYRIRLTVIDSTGQSDTVEQEIVVQDTAAPTANFTYEVNDKTVTFKNTSTVDTAHAVDVRSYSWDLNLAADSDGDTDPENDVDSTQKNPTMTYSDFGNYDVRLILTDSYGKTATTTQTISVGNAIAPLTALLTSVPQANSLDQILLSADGSNVTFYFSATGGSDKYTYSIDKNIFYDTNGDGVRDNDVDYTTTSSGSWKTPFYASYGQIVTKLTATDNETGDKDIATLQVVFEGSLGGANLLSATPSQMLLLIGSALLTAILGVTMVFRHKPLPR